MQLALAAPTRRAVQSTRQPLADLLAMVREVALREPRRAAISQALTASTGHMNQCLRVLASLHELPDATPEVLAWLEDANQAIGRASIQITSLEFALACGDVQKASRAARSMARYMREAHTKLLAIAFEAADEDVDPAACGPLSPEDLALCAADSSEDLPPWQPAVGGG
jgi:hypothetical protein